MFNLNQQLSHALPGSIGGTYAVPVLVVPQVVIGAFGRLQVVPKYVSHVGHEATSDEIDG